MDERMARAPLIRRISGVPARRRGYRMVMTDDDGTSDVLAEDEVVQVPPATEELAASVDPGSTYLPDAPDWDDQATDPHE